jgi:lysophospholipase L1-like esterase
MKKTMRIFSVMLLGLFCLSGAVPAPAQIADEFNPPQGNCCLPSQAQSLADQLQDWNQLGRYHKDNQKLLAASSGEGAKGRVVFMGDSITDMWKLDQSFPGKHYVNRGIGGQTTPQMLARMYPDVIRLSPAAVVIFAGTNDIAHNTGPMTLEMIQDNFRAMAELAKTHDIKVIFCAVTPVSDYARWPQTPARPPADILRINDWLKKYAAEIKAEYVDYYSVLVDDKGFLKDGFSMDGLHPNEKGYALMVPLVEAAIQKTLK